MSEWPAQNMASRIAGRPEDGAAPGTVIRGGLVVDGSGSSPRPLDVVVAEGAIVSLVPPGGGPGTALTVDASGCIVAPGFIDVHSHADNAPFLEEDDTTKILQGVTTEVVGNCGFSLAPGPSEGAYDLSSLLGRIFPSETPTTESMAALLALADSRGYVTNYAPLVGHSTLRVAASGTVDRRLTVSEQESMCRLLDEAMDAGVFGLSSGLIYPPGMFAPTDELVALAGRLPLGRVYATHMRGEGAHLRESIDEALSVAKEADRRVQVSHLKVAGRRNWGTIDRALEQLDEARGQGLAVGQDAYPYDASSTMLTACLPPWALEGGEESVLRRLDRVEQREKIRSEIEGGAQGSWENHVDGAGWGGILVASTGSHRYEGLTIEEIGTRTRSEPFDAFISVLRDERLRASMVIFSMSEKDVETVLRHPETMIGSDGLPPGVGGRPHPRLFGTFPRILGKYVRERGALTVGDAVRKMTALPAAAFGLKGRGELKAGAIADLVVFSLGSVSDKCDYRDPVHPPEGIRDVMIGGSWVVRDSQWLGRRAGSRLIP